MGVIFFLCFSMAASVLTISYCKKRGIRPSLPSWASVKAFLASPVTLFLWACLMRQLLLWGHTYETYADVAVLLLYGFGAVVVLAVRAAAQCWVWLSAATGAYNRLWVD